MTTTTRKGRYRPTEAKYKGGAHQMYVTYDLEQRTRGGGGALFPKVKRVYIAGEVKDWKVGRFPKKSGREAFGVRVEYEQTRKRYHRHAFAAERGSTEYTVSPADVKPATQRFVQVVEVPERAKKIHFYTGKDQLPEKYQSALQDVR